MTPAKNLKFQRTRPVNEARPLGTPRPKKASVRNLAKAKAEKISADAAENAGQTDPALSNVATDAAITPPRKDETTMTLTLKGFSKNGKAAIYSGLRSTLRLALVNFKDRTAPQTIEVSGEFAEKPAPRAKLTKEERAALPKPTLAEKAAKAEARYKKLREAAEKEAQSGQEAQHAEM